MRDLSGGSGGAGTEYSVAVRKSNHQNLLSGGAMEDLTWDTEDVDQGGLHDNANNARLTVPTGGAGRYFVWGNLIANDDIASGNYIRFLLRKNGATTLTTFGTAGPRSGGTERETLSFGQIVDLAEGDYLTVMGQSAGQSTNIKGGADASSFGMFKVK